MDFEKEIYDEGILEISELVEAVLCEFIDIENNKSSQVETAKYDLILRQIHSIKGNSGMIGLDKQYKSVHQVETFLIDTYKKVGFTTGVVDLMIDYWQKFSYSIDGQPEMGERLELFSGCFNCLKKYDYKSVCGSHYEAGVSCETSLDDSTPVETAVEVEIAEEPQIEVQNISNLSDHHSAIVMEKKCTGVLTIGNCGKVNTILESSEVSYTEFDCINEIYRKGIKLCDVSLIYLDVRSLTVNPFLLQHVFKFFDTKVEFIYLVDNKEDLSFILDEIDDIKFSFHVISYSSRSFGADISRFAKAFLPAKAVA